MCALSAAPPGPLRAPCPWHTDTGELPPTFDAAGVARPHPGHLDVQIKPRSLLAADEPADTERQIRPGVAAAAACKCRAWHAPRPEVQLCEHGGSTGLHVPASHPGGSWPPAGPHGPAATHQMWASPVTLSTAVTVTPPLLTPGSMACSRSLAQPATDRSSKVPASQGSAGRTVLHTGRCCVPAVAHPQLGGLPSQRARRGTAGGNVVGPASPAWFQAEAALPLAWRCACCWFRAAASCSVSFCMGRSLGSVGRQAWQAAMRAGVRCCRPPSGGHAWARSAAEQQKRGSPVAWLRCWPAHHHA